MSVSTQIESFRYHRISVTKLHITVAFWLLLSVTQTAGPLQQNLLATAAVFQSPAPPRPAPPSAPFLRTNPILAASTILGFNVNDLLDPNPYQWTGSMSDLYNPDAGFIDIESITNNETSSEWDVSNIQDPRGFESLFEGVVEDGYITPFVPDEEGGREMGHL